MPNPLSAIEQITFLLFIKQLDELHNRAEQEAIITGELIDPIYSKFEIRWSYLKNLFARGNV